MSVALDELDLRLIGALHLAPRAAWDDLGEVLTADPSTLKRRFDRLTEARMLRVIGQLRWGLHSATMPVHLFLDITGETPLAVLGRLRALPHVQVLAQVSGDYPVYLVVHAPSETETSAAIDRLFAVPGVRRVSALPALSTMRRGGSWDPRFLSEAERDGLRRLAGPEQEVIASTTPPEKPLSEAERTLVALLAQNGRASTAALGRAAGLATSTAHRLVRRILDEGWVKPRLEAVPAWLGFHTSFVLRLRVAPGETPEVMRRIEQLPQTRLSTHVAGEISVLCVGQVADRAALAAFIDHELAAIPGIQSVGAHVYLADLRRYWLDRDLASGLGDFHVPALLDPAG